MKKLILFLLIMVSALMAQAQVDNYALRFTDGKGVVNLGQITPVTGEKYTLQFWFCPSEWTKGAALVRSGSFSIKLGNEHALVFNDGTNHITITDGAIAKGKWCHVTMRRSAEQTQISLNNKVVRDEAVGLVVPVKTNSLWLGGGFLGRIDEVRVWRIWLAEDYDSFYNNTINKFHPKYTYLSGYWKMDQEQCPNVYDNKRLFNGTMSATGVVKEKVTDNDAFKYRITLGYGNVERFYDRTIDADHYGTLANHVSILGIWTYDDGTARLYSQNDAGVMIDGAERLESVGTRTGVLSLPTEDAAMELPASALPSDATEFTFECWVNVDEWTEGAYIMRKEVDENTGISLRLGTTGKFIARLNGKNVTIASNKQAGTWYHIGFTSSKWTTVSLTSSGEAKMYLGKGFKGKLDDVLIWTQVRSDAQISSDGDKIPYPGPSTQLGAWDWYKMAACYDFNKENDPGFDRFSVQGFVDEMHQLAGNPRGVKFTVTAVQPNDLDGTMSNATKRETMGKMLAEIGNDPYIDGIDIDFEWTYSEAGWTNIAKMTHVLRENLNAGKILSVSPHKVSYKFPKSYMGDIDYFNFQIYGPQANNYTDEGFESAAKSFIDWGFPREKIVLSYATTTSKGTNGSAIQGYRYIYNDKFTNNTTTYTNDSGESWTVCSYNQAVSRTDYAKHNGLGGIMYWDMGNDLPGINTHSLARASCYSIASNVEALVTSVSKCAAAPEDDTLAPVETEDPEDQGGCAEESKTLTSLDELSNTMAVNLINKNGMGIIYHNATSSNVWLAESSNSNFAQTIDHDSEDALWLILQREGKYYLYNVGSEQFVTVPNFNVTSQPCTLSSTPAELEMTGNDGVFTFRTYDSTNEKGYMCTSPQLTAKPVCQWTADDSGSQWQIVTVPIFDAKNAAAEAESLIDYYYNGEEIEAANKVKKLAELDNSTAYNIKNAEGLGVIYNAGKTNVWLGESSNSNFSTSVNHYNANSLWLVIKYDKKYYLYNVGKEQFINVPTFNVTSQACTFTDVPFALELTCTSEKFTMREYGSTAEKGYMCAAPQNTSAPLAQWTSSDSGSKWTIIAVPAFDVAKVAEVAWKKIDAVTGIEHVEDASITRPQQIYNLQGQRLNTMPTRGIVIVNGKKMIR